ncbi:mitogen-activated protein kinase kinase kinase 18-like [Salvia miltiorrhiza]|uniref:mitogen-activated protein kinase kinase kinase 18-like n=1 Tax=Salvia miltiorrhiza TaxID=226208 RepID=UPI0025AC96DA|nr:mitogen-activated protein kinase kinase kinase 18-like [Salvia miltiorrhiza]
MEWTRGHIIGHGASAAVSIAVSRISGDVFAVKSAELARSESLQREQRILSTLNSPHIIGYKGFDITVENATSVFNLMIEHAPDGALTDALRRGGGRLPEAAIRRYARGIVIGLEHLHSRGIVHCDIKGSNVLVAGGGAAKIADFGCAKAAGEAAAIAGTPMFMAPEAARGEEQGFAADVWAVGCTVIEMATGRAPWPEAAETLRRIAFSGEAPEFPAVLSELGKDFLSKCLRVDRRERWTAKELLRHPFLDDFELIGDGTDSPTSVLDHGIWSSVEEESSHDSIEMDLAEFFRFKEICMNSRIEKWDWTESWITIRDGENVDFGSNGRFLEVKNRVFLLS